MDYQTPPTPDEQMIEALERTLEILRAELRGLQMAMNAINPKT